ncbi:hypothetical protein CLUG_02290 [Clavispora lusitaniae ATCC 42720]|uniref:Galactose-1-phosphate uridylyltransferase n=1 Tax=Clavispora lusitaniae (strain ATCC 42720) TaxID=306902 RepID=C4Y258_CLAL4|nr:uncharacterized protein CLUG_02290 [Clavispora lusitaniae ATCC 42720]EEQ38167.1 hypothetical protein CLUG_02290 [Clavispora lusitaniae ATCC 42720]
MSFSFTDHSHRRYNPLSDTYVLCSPHRAKRPWQGAQEEVKKNTQPEYDPKCYLCPGNTRAANGTNPAYTSTYVFPNDFPAVQLDSPDYNAQEEENEDAAQKEIVPGAERERQSLCDSLQSQPCSYNPAYGGEGHQAGCGHSAKLVLGHAETAVAGPGAIQVHPDFREQGAGHGSFQPTSARPGMVLGCGSHRSQPRTQEHEQVSLVEQVALAWRLCALGVGRKDPYSVRERLFCCGCSVSGFVALRDSFACQNPFALACRLPGQEQGGSCVHHQDTYYEIRQSFQNVLPLLHGLASGTFGGLGGGEKQLVVPHALLSSTFAVCDSEEVLRGIRDVGRGPKRSHKRASCRSSPGFGRYHPLYCYA